ncbi:putative hexose carrier protein [Eutypa lata UCREL1]|uniref:Putative hexose carrier protein n=1 Tax=Eutypa lata (strain UCR-EL1) TaxID=1287681 RepID=M7STE9_EUTLA|nr:putative hexose carrier protein [Eutypa lata UCREL1]
MLDGYALEVTLTAANSAAQAWYGYEQGVVSGMIISQDFIKVFPETMDPDVQGITLGNLLGCLLAATFGDRLGRKNTLRNGGVISAIGAILQFTAYSFPQLIVGRVVNGVGNGILSSTCGIFQAESCASDRRGKLSVIVVLHNVVFYCIATWLTLACSFTDGGWQWRLPLAVQQFGGINALNYFFTIILTQNVGLNELLARILTGCNATSYMISSACAFWIIDRFGRRSLMLTGLSLQSLAYVMVAIALGMQSTAPFEWGIVAVSFLFFYYAAFGCTWGMVPWVYQSEVNSLAMRTVGAAAATSTNWLFGFVCTQFTPTGIANIGYRFYIIFAIFNLAFIFVVYFLYPETANRTLEDLDAYFDRDAGHPTIIPIGDKTSKSTKRPQEAIDAEASRIELAATMGTKAKVVSVEHAEDVHQVA